MTRNRIQRHGHEKRFKNIRKLLELMDSSDSEDDHEYEIMLEKIKLLIMSAVQLECDDTEIKRRAPKKVYQRKSVEDILNEYNLHGLCGFHKEEFLRLKQVFDCPESPMSKMATMQDLQGKSGPISFEAYLFAGMAYLKGTSVIRVENAIGFLKNKFRILHNIGNCKLIKVSAVIEATARLHNFLIREGFVEYCNGRTKDNLSDQEREEINLRYEGKPLPDLENRAGMCALRN
eukprot:Nk52_evm16s2485 gene=Nk52_evmTU16s2485